MSTWKVLNTVYMLWSMGMARHFGDYIHSGFNQQDIHYALYRWRGREWVIPTSCREPSDER